MKPHTDYFFPETPLDKRHDMSRLQGTLFLSKYGEDYEEGGFNFTSNQGQWLTFGRDVEINPGDLVVWHYQNKHAVAPLATKPGQIGFLRYIFPPEIIFEKAPRRKFNLTELRRLVSSAIPPAAKMKIQKILERKN